MLLATLVRRSATQAWYVLFASVCLLGGFQLVLVAQAASIETSQAFGRIAEFVPAFLQRGLGSQALLLASFKGAVSFGYFHPAVTLLVAVLAAYLSTEPAHDVESGLVDVVLARSVPRRRVITRSLLLSMAAVGAAAIVMGTGTWIGLNLFASDVSAWPQPVVLVTLAVHLMAVAWLFGALGLAVAAGSSRWRTAFATVALAAVVMYLVDFLAIGWPAARSFAWISPFDYYPAIPIMAGTAPKWSNLATLWSVTAVLVAVAYWRFERRDL
jgi:ABC-type transport system involved in multi-copper enzyme maturation permease subunit